jgi:Cyclic nucleotide-binding domain
MSNDGSIDLTAPTHELEPSGEKAREFARDLIEDVAQLKMPELFRQQHQDAIYYLANRNGVSVVVLRTPALSGEQLTKLLKYRLAQYLSVGFIDPQKVYEARLQHEPVSLVHPKDIHYIACSSASGKMLCYATLRSVVDAPGATMRMRERPLFPVEEDFGWGIFNQLRLLPDLAVNKVRELSRFVKNQQLAPFDELGTRAPVEIGVALTRTLTGVLRMEIDAFIGDFEESIGKRNLDFFHLPMVVLHGTLPYVADGGYLIPRFSDSAVYPFAALVSDLEQLMGARLARIEEGLRLPGKQGILALISAKRELTMQRSGLEPEGGLSPLIDADVPQKGLSMNARRRMLDRGQKLHKFAPFAALSLAEATTLRSFMEQVEVEAGKTLIHKGDEADCVYLIEDGEAQARDEARTGEQIILGTMGPGEYFGEISLLTGGPRTADVVSRTPMKLLKLSRDTYEMYLTHMVEVESKMALTAARRAGNSLRKIDPK